MLSRCVFLVFVLFFISFTAVTAIKCFQCVSAVDEGCADLTVNDTDSKYYKECTGDHGEQFFCRKLVHTVLNGDKKPRVYRQCGWITNEREDRCLKRDSDFILEMNCLCTTDGCNGSNGKQFNTVLLIFSVIITIFLNRK